MLKRIKNLFKRKPKKFIVLGTTSFSKESALDVAKAMGVPVILAKNVSDVKMVSQEEEIIGDGKAEFIGPGTEDEWKEQENADKGMKGIFGL